MRRLTSFLTSALLFVLTRPVLAAADPLGGLQNAAGGAGFNVEQRDPIQIISTIINAFLGLLGIIFVILMLYAGFLWMTAAGNEEKVSQAKKLIMSAVIGIVIVMSAYAIASFVIGAVMPKEQAS